MCRLAAALVLLGWISLLVAPVTNANELTRHTISRGDVADRLNREQLPRPGTPAAEAVRSRVGCGADWNSVLARRWRRSERASSGRRGQFDIHRAAKRRGACLPEWPPNRHQSGCEGER